MVDCITKKWIRNRSDELAVSNGCRFDVERGEHVIHFFQQFLRFYEGTEWVGKHFIPLPWQEDLLMRAYGWIRYSSDWNRDVRRFRKVSVWLPKKNGKSPLAAGNGLYLLVYDGEYGQKVFSSARDGRQAGIMHAHARMMVQSSPELDAECKINKSTGRIAHLPTNSFYDILAGDNIRGQEGLNGSVIIDETHVCDDRLAKVLEYMGASRSEPMQWEFSTAGEDPESYGRRQYEYGKSVERGDILDDGFLFVCYEAPQNATDDDIQNNPELWHQANPSWGVTIKETEFRDSLQRARKSLSDWITFKRYRLNIWATSVNPWLPMDRWESCYREFTEDDFHNKECWAGIDLSKTQDMSALVLVFKGDDGEYFLLPYFWLPEDVAKDKNHLASFVEWADKGYLELCPGNTIDYRFIKRRFIEIAQKFNVLNILYDNKFADQLTQEINEEIGIPRTVFPQSIMAFAGPTAGFEGDVIAGKIHHNGNPILTWQAGNTQVRTDSNCNKRPVKPRPIDIKKIDGIVAAIMAYAGATTPEQNLYVPGAMLDREPASAHDSKTA